MKGHLCCGEQATGVAHWSLLATIFLVRASVISIPLQSSVTNTSERISCRINCGLYSPVRGLWLGLHFWNQRQLFDILSSLCHPSLGMRWYERSVDLAQRRFCFSWETSSLMIHLSWSEHTHSPGEVHWELQSSPYHGHHLRRSGFNWDLMWRPH